MQSAAWICAILAAMPVLASERITVSICIRGRLDDKLVAGAESAASALFRAADIDVTWAQCEIGLEGDDALEQHWYTVRLRNGRPFIPAAPAMHDTLGEAFTSIDAPGYIAEVYYEAVQSLAYGQQIDVSRLMGYALAHELGHLVLGPRHAPLGLMRGGWNMNDLAAMRQGCLKFTPAEGQRMRDLLHATVRRAATAP